MALNERSLKNLVGVHPDLVRVVHRAAEISTVPIVVTEGLRNLERQRELKDAGKSWTLDSRHLTGHAVDLVDADDFKYDIPDMDHIADAMKAAAAEFKTPIVWGGTWKQRDTPHFELDKKAYPASGINISQKAKEVALKVVTSKPVLTAGGAAAGGGAAVSTDAMPVPANLPAIPAPPDLAPYTAWKGFGETLAGLWGFAWQNLLLTALLAAILAALYFLPKQVKP